MRIYSKSTVYEAASKRIEWLFDEFPNVVVSVSGGKDSTVIFYLTLEVARRRNRLPLNVLFVDQEGEWESTIENVREIMYRPDVTPYWLQVPLKLFNAAAHNEHWLTSWDENCKEDWVHPQDPISYKDNVYGKSRFSEIFDAAIAYHFKDIPTANIGGVRADENPTRLVGLTFQPPYKWATWGKKLNPNMGHYTFYPIYDWAMSDVWHYIVSNDLSYNRLYDMQYRYGVHLRSMRVSNLFHEVAVYQLFYLQEFEGATYAKLAKRLQGIDAAGKAGADDYFVTDELPFMFESWREYRDYLLEHLIDNPEWRQRMARRFVKNDYDLGEILGATKYKRQIQSILTHDWEGIKIANFRSSGQARKAADIMKKERAEANV